MRFGLSAVISEPSPYTARPSPKARSRPRMSPSFAPTSMNAAITSVYIVIALCTPVTVVFRSATICEIETFITLESSTMMNWADARMISGSHLRTARLYAVQPLAPRRRPRASYSANVSTATGSTAGVSQAELAAIVRDLAAQVVGSGARRVLLVPPDQTRLHSRAGRSLRSSSGCSTASSSASTSCPRSERTSRSGPPSRGSCSVTPSILRACCTTVGATM